jgi:hypothetical protein
MSETAWVAALPSSLHVARVFLGDNRYLYVTVGLRF